MVKSKEVIQAQSEIIFGYYGRIAQNPNVTIEDIILWLEDDIREIGMENLLNDADKIVNKQP